MEGGHTVNSILPKKSIRRLDLFADGDQTSITSTSRSSARRQEPPITKARIAVEIRRAKNSDALDGFSTS